MTYFTGYTNTVTAAGVANFSAVANVHIPGGSNTQVLTTDGTGNLNWTSNGVGNSLYFGSFYSNVLQTNPSNAAINTMTLNNTIANSGVFVANSTQVTVQNAGLYNIQFSAQIDKTDAGADYAEIFLSKNGVAVADTNTQVYVQGNNDKSVAAWNFIVPAVANDYFELNWWSNDLNLRLYAQGANAGPPSRPGIPSVILTVTQA